MAKEELLNGQSELDTVKLKIVFSDFGQQIHKEITHWESYSLTSNFLQPCDSFQFRISGPDMKLYQDVLGLGSKVQISINDNIQCTGYIESTNISASVQGGRVFTLNGRDILCRLVNANEDPTFGTKITSGMNLVDVIAPNIPLYNLGILYDNPNTHLNIITGLAKGDKGATSSTTITNTTVIGQNADGTFNTKQDQVTITTVSNKSGLKKITLKDLKPNPNEGAYAYIDRILKRQGFILKAVCDGSGIMVIAPQYTGSVDYHVSLRDKSDPGSVNNNVLSSDVTVNWQQQPSLIVATGSYYGGDFAKANLKVIMINELVGLDNQGNYLPEVQAILGKYKGATVLPLRTNLIRQNPLLTSTNAFCPVYLKDDDSKDIAQLSRFVTRKMGEYQMKELSVKYTVVGHTQNGHPWAVNTLVNVMDDTNNIHEVMWVMERAFHKSVTGGTTTTLSLIRLDTLQFGG